MLRDLVVASLRGYAAVLFSDSRWIGLALLGATFFNPRAGLAGLAGVIVSNLVAMLFRVHRDRVRKGLYAFNGLLVGLSLSLYYPLDARLFALLLVSMVLLFFITLALEHALGYFFALPALSLPFVVTGLIIYFSFFNYPAFVPEAAAAFPGDARFPALPEHLLLYLKSLGAVFFQTSPWAGLVVAAVLVVYSRLAFLLSLVGYAAGVSFHLFLGGGIADIAPGSIGFNNILTAVALGGIFLVPGPRPFLLAALAAMASTLVGAFAKIFLVNFSMPVLALPFVTVTLLFLYGIRLLANRGFRVVDFPPGSPEKNIDYFKTRLQRFGDGALEIRLPFLGRWRVTQAYDGPHTHRLQWRESLDFMAVGPDGSLKRGERQDTADYHTFGLPVLAPADGEVVHTVDHLEDNPAGEMDTKNNWGNLVLLRHGPLLFSQLSHLQQSSLTVKEGDRVKAGDKIALAGNSGRSGEPHLHLHFQTRPEIGSPTTGVPFTQLLHFGETPRILFNHVPEEGAEVSNLAADFNIRAFFNIVPGTTYRPVIVDTRGDHRTESWQAGVDFWGNRFLEDGAGARLFFTLAREYFACLDYQGSHESALFRFFIAAYRVPFIGRQVAWEDRLSHSLFSRPAARLLLDIALPFTDRFSGSWEAVMETTDAGFTVASRAWKGRERGIPLCTHRLELSGNFPGKLLSTRSGGGTLEIRA